MPRLIVIQQEFDIPMEKAVFEAVNNGTSDHYLASIGEKKYSIMVFKPNESANNKDTHIVQIAENPMHPLTIATMIDLAAWYWGVGADVIISPDSDKHFHVMGLRQVPNNEDVV